MPHARSAWRCELPRPAARCIALHSELGASRDARRRKDMRKQELEMYANAQPKQYQHSAGQAVRALHGRAPRAPCAAAAADLVCSSAPARA